MMQEWKWDTTCPDTFPPFNLARSTSGSGEEKKNTPNQPYLTSGIYGPETSFSLKQSTRDQTASQHLWQWLSMAVQRGNATSIEGCSLMDELVSVCSFMYIITKGKTKKEEGKGNKGEKKKERKKKGEKKKKKENRMGKMKKDQDGRPTVC